MITFYIPTTEDLWFREKLLGDAETMSYNHAWGGTIDFPPSRWTQWHRKWIDDQNSHYFYRYLCAEGEFVGEAAYHFEEERSIWLADVLIYAPLPGKRLRERSTSSAVQNCPEQRYPGALRRHRIR